MAKCLDNVKIIKELRRNDGYVCRRLNSKILYITGCTSTKCKEPSLIPAYTRYEGDASKRMLRFFKDNCVFHKEGRIFDLYVLSAGYGFIPADQVIQNYDVTFQKTTISLKKEMAQKLELRVDFSKLLNQGYKLIILRLGGEYIKALNSVAPKDGYVIPEGTKICYLATSNKIKVPKEFEY